MGKHNKFGILLDQKQAVYSAGNHFKGKCVVDLKEPMKMRGKHGIYLKIKGEATVHWTVSYMSGSGNRQQEETRHYCNNESYMDFTVVIFGNPAESRGADSVMHPEGKHIYPFQIQLPQNLPSSFEGEHGQIRYYVTATIDKPWKFNHTTRRYFTMLSVLDLNLQPKARSSKQGQKSKTLCCLCCASGPISAVFRIDRRGFVPGEVVTISGEVDNKSNRRMNSSSVLLIMYTTFIEEGGSKQTTKKTITEIRKGPIEKGHSETWSGEQLAIPPLPPSSLIHCNIIDVSYVLTMNVDPSGPSLDLEVPLLITIGTIPLTNMMGVYASAPFSKPNKGAAMNEENTNPALPNTPLPTFSMPDNRPSAQPSAPRLSYSECAFGKVDTHDENDSQYTIGERNFAPVYTYYNWDKQPNT